MSVVIGRGIDAEGKMAVISRGVALLGAMGTFAVLTQGCVSYDAFQKKQQECEANQAAYQGADAAIGNVKKENDLLRLKATGLERDLAAANQRSANGDLAVQAKYEDLKQRYQEMVEKLKDEQGNQWTINKDTGGLVLEESVYFAPGRSELKESRFGALDQLIAKLMGGEFAGKTIEVAGHTDSDPIARSGWKDNYQLSAERARAILVYFQKKGIGPERIYLSGYGPSRPRSQKKSENRRVEIVLHER